MRELENCVEYMVNMNDSQIMQPASLPAKIRDANTAGPRPHHGAPLQPGTIASLLHTEEVLPMEVYEEEIIRKAVAVYGNSTEGKRKAAEALGISLATLYRKVGKK